MIRVCHLTSAHNAYDTRIFYKECISLSKNGYDVHLVAPNSIEGVTSGVQVHSVSRKSTSRISRAIITAFKVLKKGLSIKAKVYHFHDPELVWVGIILRMFGKKVIFDIHENIRGQIKIKKWLPFRELVAKCYFVVDWIAAKLFYLILAENSYESIYKGISNKYTIVLNLPDIDGLEGYKIEDRSKLENGILYIGSVAQHRGILDIIEALSIMDKKKIDFHFHCVGPFSDNLPEMLEANEFYPQIKDKITFYGLQPVYEAYKLSEKCKLGLSVLQPIENYLNSYSTKVFEYMAIGLPFIVSDFELYRFVKEDNVGVLIDPLSAGSIAFGLESILLDSTKGNQMGENGVRIVNKEFTWESQEKKLLNFYQSLLSN